MRKFLSFSFLSIVSVAIVAIALVKVTGEKDNPSLQENSAPDPETQQRIVTDTLMAGESLYASMVTKGISAPKALEVLRALSSELDPRSCKPGDSYAACIDSAGSIKLFSFQRGLTETYVAELDSAGYRILKKHKSLTYLTRRISGTISTSLWEAFLEIGEDPEVALKLADVFAWEIDFLTDPRQGDTFVIIFDEIYCDGRRIGTGDILGARYVNRGHEYLAFGFPGEDGKMEYFDESGNSLERVFLKSPLNYRRITSYFSRRRFHPILKIYRPHYGVDYAAPTGTPVVSIGDGRVVYAGWKGGFGRYIEIRHNNVYSTSYGHLSRFARGIHKGVRVKQGQVIGYVGATGLATGPHLDFRVKRFGSYVNPLTVDYPRAKPLPEEKRDEFFAERDMILRGLKPPQIASANDNLQVTSSNQ